MLKLVALFATAIAAFHCVGAERTGGGRATRFENSVDQQRR
jgi:hypothetical protein